MKAFQYDIVCSVELSSGAIRITGRTLRQGVRDAGYSKEEVETQFGGMLNALVRAARGGSAPGIDRIVTIADGPIFARS